ncbi:hypothetical protein [Bartonella sp. F02]|uniref:hypothetical protein n=1 Tax=Bartonella sp. F02 TaxID=2967262 RepID=UPI0022A938DC|nr:hypothetical protein [Bartonella sp. F02]MCZ2328878.1 hypothetical protein [Bartonella sp. F02]
MIQQQNTNNSYSIHLTDQWSWDKILLYQEEINEAMKKYAERFPEDVCLEMMAKEILNGQTQLWLILKNQTQFRAFVITKIEMTHNGKKRVVLLDLAGKGGLKLVKLIETIEEWARKINADEVLALGRVGWAKKLAQHGYATNLIHYRKVLKP